MSKIANFLTNLIKPSFSFVDLFVFTLICAVPLKNFVTIIIMIVLFSLIRLSEYKINQCNGGKR